MKRRGFLGSLFAIPAAAKALAETPLVNRAIEETPDISVLVENTNGFAKNIYFSFSTTFSASAIAAESILGSNGEPPFFTKKF